jgi:hypothetical protein
MYDVRNEHHGTCYRSLSNIGQAEDQTIARDSVVVVHEIDPLADSRWDELVAHCPDASIFHTRACSRYCGRPAAIVPLVCATTRGTQLEEAVVFYRIESWLTGRGLVSLPFSDHCQPLAS